MNAARSPITIRKKTKNRKMVIEPTTKTGIRMLHVLGGQR